MRATQLIIAGFAAIAAARPLAAQDDLFTAELRPFVGAFVPIGKQGDDFRSATMLGGQAAIELSRYAHFVTSVSWTYGHARFSGLADDLTFIWQYDAGAEFNLIGELTTDWVWRPFVGIGGGGRTYDYRAKGVDTRTCTAGYGAVGSELERGNIAVRFEARDYVTCFESPLTGRKSTRTDLGLTLGFAYHLR
jgi:hypothetical protein